MKSQTKKTKQITKSLEQTKLKFESNSKELSGGNYITLYPIQDNEINFEKHLNTNQSSKEIIEVIDRYGYLENYKIWYGGKKETIKLGNKKRKMITAASDIDLTTIKSENTSIVGLKKERLKYLKRRNRTYKNNLFKKLGFIQGDGTLSVLNTEKRLVVNIGKKDVDCIVPFFGFEVNKNGCCKYYTYEFTEILNELNFDKKTIPYRKPPKNIERWDKKEVADFICGLYSANGCVLNDSIKLTSTSFETISKTQKLLKEFDIDTTILKVKGGDKMINNKKRKFKEYYDLHICSYLGFFNFYYNINFIHKYKQNKLRDLLNKKSPMVTNINYNGYKHVFYIESPENIRYAIYLNDDYKFEDDFVICTSLK